MKQEFKQFSACVSVSTELYFRMTTNKIEPVRTALEENVTLTTFQ